MAVSGGIAMDGLLLLSKVLMRRIEPYFSSVARDCEG